MLKATRNLIGILALLLVMLCFAGLAEADVALDSTNFPDANFLQYLKDAEFDTDRDGKLSDAEISKVKSIDCDNRSISDLTGIGYFTALKELSCQSNLLTSLDVSGNTALGFFRCDSNQLTSLNVSKNTAIWKILCYNNQLTSLDLSGATALRHLYCYGNRLKSLDVSVNTALLYLSCHNNELTSLDVSRNTALMHLECNNNRLTGLDVSTNTSLEHLQCHANSFYTLDLSKSSRFVEILKTETKVDMQSYWLYREAHPKLKEGYLTFDKTVRVHMGGGSYIEPVDWMLNSTNFPDANFLKYLRDAEFDADGDGVLSAEEISNVELIDCSEKSISDLKGLGIFTALTELACYTNKLTSLDVSRNTALTYLDCHANQLTSLDVSSHTALAMLDCSTNQLTGLDVSRNTALTSLDFDGNRLTSVDLSKNTALTDLSCSSNKLTSLDVSKNTALVRLICRSNQLTSLDVSSHTALKWLACDSNQLTSLNVNGDNALVRLVCHSNKLTSLDVSSNTTLEKLECDNNQLTSLDMSSNTALKRLECRSNLLTSLNMGKNTVLRSLRCENNSLEALDVSQCTVVVKILKIGTLTHEGTYWKYISSMNDVSFDKKVRVHLGGGVYIEPYGEVVLNSTNFPDANFLKYIKDAGFDADGDGKLSAAEISKVKKIDCSEKNISDLKGIAYFKDLTELLCYSNQLTSLNVSTNTALAKLDCHDNQLASLDVNMNLNAALVSLDCHGNLLKSLSISHNTALTEFDCHSNQLTSLDVSSNTKLPKLDCHANKLTSLDVSSNTALTELNCHSNQLTSLDVSRNTALTELDCHANQLTSLNVGKSTELRIVQSEDNSLEALDVSQCPVLVETLKKGTRKNEDTYWRYVNSSKNDFSFDKKVRVHLGGGIYIEPYGEVMLNSTNFPDANFLKYIKNAGFDADGDGKLSAAEISNVKKIDCSEKSISNLKGIAYFMDLTELLCYSNQLTSLDVSRNTVLARLDCHANQLASLDMSMNMNAALKRLDCHSNLLTSLNVNSHTALTELDCHANLLTGLDVSSHTVLTELDCNYNKLTSLDVSSNTALVKLDCHSNQLTSLDVSKNTALARLDCRSNQLTSLDVSKNTVLVRLDCDSNQLTSLDMSKNTVLVRLDCHSNKLTSLDVSGNTALTRLDCHSNQLTSLNVSSITALKTLTCGSNQLTSLDVSKNTALTELACSKNQLTKLNVSGCTVLTALMCEYNQLTGLDVKNNTELTRLYCFDNQIASLNVSKNTELRTLQSENNLFEYLDVSQCSVLVETLKKGTKEDGGTCWRYKDGSENYVSFDKKVRVHLGGGSYIGPERGEVVPTGITLNKNKATVVAGKKLTLKVTLTPADVETTLTWSSSNTKVARVSKKGVVTAVAEGTAIITVTTDNGLEDTCKITVTPPQAKAITLNKKKATLEVGKKLSLRVSVTPAMAEPTLTWKSSNRKVARVSARGVVTAVAKGSAIITVSTDNGLTATCKITVNPPAATSIKLNKKAATLAIDKSLTLKVTISPANAEPTLTWSSSNKKVVKVNQKGKVIAVGKGTAIITVKTDNGKKATCKITVE